MSFFDKVKGAINSGRDELTRQVGRFKNKKFMQITRNNMKLALQEH